MLKTAIDNLNHLGGGTNFVDGLRRVRTEVFDHSGNRDSTPNVVLFITDGTPRPQQQTETMLEASHLRDVSKIVAVGITSSVDVAMLEGITGAAEWVLLLENFSALLRSIRSIVNLICPQFATIGTSTEPSTFQTSESSPLVSITDLVPTTTAEATTTPGFPGEFSRIIPICYTVITHLVDTLNRDHSL